MSFQPRKLRPQLPADEQQADDRRHGDDPGDDPVTSLADHRLDVVIDAGGEFDGLAHARHRRAPFVDGSRARVPEAVGRAARGRKWVSVDVSRVARNGGDCP